MLDEIGRYYEGFLAEHWRELTSIKKLLEALRDCEGAPSSWGERVQGGERTPAALRRVEIMDALDRCYPPLVEVVKVFEAQREKKKAAYCHALIDGLSGAAAIKSRGIGAQKHREYRQWLTRDMLRIEKRHGIR